MQPFSHLRPLSTTLSNALSKPLNSVLPRKRLPSARAMASTPDASSGPDNNSTKKTPLPLPAPPEGGDAISLDVSGGGSTVKLDHLGPLVVGVDGTLARIGNWQEMSEIERQNTLRVLGKRNKLRLEKLKAGTTEEQTGDTETKADGKDTPL